MLDDPLSAFELLVDNSMLTHVQKCTEAEAHRVKNSDEWKLPLSELKAFIFYEEHYVERTKLFLNLDYRTIVTSNG